MGFSGLDIVSAGLHSAVGGNKKAKVPLLKPINIDEEQRAALAANQNILPQAQALAGDVNQFNQDQLESLYGQALPGYDRIKQQVSDNISSMTRGELPDDVVNEIYRRSSSQAYAGGFGGTPLGRNLTSRDLGLTSLDLMGRGQDSAQKWLSTTVAPQMDVTSMFISPMQRIGVRTAERDTQFNRDWMSSQVSALGTVGQQAARNMISNY